MRNVIMQGLDRQKRELWEIDKYLWLSLAYALVYIFIAQARGLLLAPVWVLWTLLALGAVNGAARSVLRFHRIGSETASSRPLPWVKVFTIVDVLLIGCAIAVTGGLDSDLWLLYFVAVISESLYTSPLHTAVVASGIAAIYTLAALPAQLSIHRLGWPQFATTLSSRIFF